MKKLLTLLLLIGSLPLMAGINWSAPTTISDAGVNASNPVMGMAANGYVVAIWLEGGSLMYSTLSYNGSWRSPVAITNGNSSAPQIAVDNDGNATAIWVQSGAIQTATMLYNQSWGSTTTLASSGSSVPQIAVDPSGDVVAVWVNGGVIYSATQIFGGSWPATPDTLSTTTEADAPQIAIGTGSDVAVIWHSMWPTTSMNTIFVTTKTIGEGWSSPLNISSSYQNSVYPQIAVDPNGNATAIWYTYNMVGENAYVNVTLQSAMMDAVNSLWSSSTKLSGPSCINPARLMAQIQYDSLGNAVAMWTDSANSTYFTIYMSYMMLSNGTMNWIGPTLIKFDYHCYQIDFAITSMGDIFAAYVMTDSSSNVAITAAQSHSGGTNFAYWAYPTEISNTAANLSPQIAAVFFPTANATYATAIWRANNGTNAVIQASSGAQRTLLPPTNLSVTQGTNSYGIFTEYYNTLTWTASTDVNVKKYVIYRNGICLNTTNSSTLQYIDRNQPQNAAAVYSVSAIDSTGFIQSSILSYTFH